MRKRIVDLFVLDALVSIDRIKRYSKGLHDCEALRKNETLCSAILRELGIIGEAINRILQVKTIEPLIKPSWRDIVDFRNIVIHEYFGLSFEEIYIIINRDLLTFEKEMIVLFKKLWKEKSMQQPFEDTLDELCWMERDESVKYLKRLKKSVLEKTKSKDIKITVVKKTSKKVLKKIR